MSVESVQAGIQHAKFVKLIWPKRFVFSKNISHISAFNTLSKSILTGLEILNIYSHLYLGNIISYSLYICETFCWTRIVSSSDNKTQKFFSRFFSMNMLCHNDFDNHRLFLHCVMLRPQLQHFFFPMRNCLPLSLVHQVVWFNRKKVNHI